MGDTGTYSYSFQHGDDEEEEERRIKLAMVNGENNGGGGGGGGNQFKTISPPTYGDDGVREVPMDREIPIQRPRDIGENNRARNNHVEARGGGGEEAEEEDDVASEATSASPNGSSPPRQIRGDDYVDENGVSSGTTVSVSVSVKESLPTKIGTQARRLVSPSPMHESSTNDTVFDNLD